MAQTLIAHVLTGSREEIIEQLSCMDGHIRDVVVVLYGPDPDYPPMTEEESDAFLAEMDRQAAAEGTEGVDVDFSREAIYERYPGE